MTLGSSPIAALISLRLVISLSMDSNFFSVTKLAAWGERVEASHPILSTSEVLHDA